MLSDAAIAALAAGSEPFAFFPPIRGFAENRWRFHQATRAEFSATNAASNQVVWFARASVSYLTVEEGAVTVTLRRELEYSDSAVWPLHEMRNADPRQAGAGSEMRNAGAAIPIPPPGPGPRSRWEWNGEPLMMVLATAAGAAAALVLALVVARGVLQPPQRADSPPISDSRLFTLVREDNYHDVLRKLGPPESERELSVSGSDVLQRALLYPDRNYAVVLLGVRGQRNYEQEPHYIGAVRLSDGAVVASVHLAHDSTTDSLLKFSARQLRDR